MQDRQAHAANLRAMEHWAEQIEADIPLFLTRAYEQGVTGSHSTASLVNWFSPVSITKRRSTTQLLVNVRTTFFVSGFTRVDAAINIGGTDYPNSTGLVLGAKNTASDHSFHAVSFLISGIAAGARSLQFRIRAVHSQTVSVDANDKFEMEVWEVPA
jgi:hypothetical protein